MQTTTRKIPCFIGSVALLVMGAGCSTKIVRGEGSGGSDVVASGGSGGVGGVVGQGGAGGFGGFGGAGGQNECAAAPPVPKASWSSVFDVQGIGNVEIPVVDPGGQIWIGGTLNGSAELGGGKTISSNGVTRIFLANLDALGQTTLGRVFDGNGDQELRALSFDNAGHLLLAGGFYESIDLGGGPLITNFGYEGFVAKLDVSTGAHVWSQAVPIQISGLAVDAANNVVFVGTCNGLNNYDYCIQKLDPDGNLLWKDQFGDAATQITITVAVDEPGNIWLGGSFVGSVDFGGGPLVSPSGDAFLAKLDPGGIHQFSRRLGSGWVSRIRTSAAGEVVVAAGGDVIDFGNGIGSGGFNIVAKLDSAGNVLWDRRFGGLMVDNIFDVALDAAGNVFATGLMASASDLGGCVSDLQGSVFLTKLGAGGARLWTGRYGEQGAGYGLAAFPMGGMVLAGMFSGKVDFGDNPQASVGAEQDGFVVLFP